MNRALILGTVVSVAIAWTTVSQAQSDGSLDGKITGYECGDNCYLTILDEYGGEHTGLCVADICRPLNKATQMPKRYVGRKVNVQVGMGVQLNGSGDVMGRALAFRTIRFR